MHSEYSAKKVLCLPSSNRIKKTCGWPYLVASGKYCQRARRKLQRLSRLRYQNSGSLLPYSLGQSQCRGPPRIKERGNWHYLWMRGAAESAGKVFQCTTVYLPFQPSALSHNQKLSSNSPVCWMKVNSLLPGGILHNSNLEERQPANSWMISENHEVMVGEGPKQWPSQDCAIISGKLHINPHLKWENSSFD